MKIRLTSPVLMILAAAGWLSAVRFSNAFAQSPPHDLPVVTLTAPDATASESGDPARFRLFRAGPTNLALNVYWIITGSATWGLDYEPLPFGVSIPAGVREVVVPVTPLEDKFVEGRETVEARLFYPPIEAPQTYLIGSPSNAVVAIEDNDPDTNHPPAVALVAPTNGAVFPFGSPFQIIASATDPDEHDYVDRVEFFDGEISLGIRTNCLPCAGPLPPFLLFASLPPGNHVLRAKATDSRGASSLSAPVEVSVIVPSPPVVTIQATHPNAVEPGGAGFFAPGVFRVSRTGPTDFALPVYYSIHGTASNAVDYVAISNQVVIPIGQAWANVMILPLGDNLTEGTETVVLRLADIACPTIFPPPRECYAVGVPREAVVKIADSMPPTNSPPTVNILSPTNGQTFFWRAMCPPCVTNIPPCNTPCYFVGPDITICADARDADGYVNTVEFFAGTNRLGIRTNCLPCDSVQNPFCLVWSNVPPGEYVLTAVVTDNLGAPGVSDPVKILVKETPPPTNQPPSVSIVFPTDGTAFTAPADILLLASARDPDGNIRVAHVEFFEGEHKIGDGQLSDPRPLHDAPFRFFWTNVPPGEYVIHARITDEQGGKGDSEPVHLKVGPLPPTNHPPVVNLWHPPNGAIFTTPTGIDLRAYAEDPEDGYRLTVEFFRGDHSLGFGTFVQTACPSPYCPFFSLTWSNVPPGEYVLTAKATDGAGAMAVSTPIHVTVREPATNLPPNVRLTKPSDGMTFVTPAIVGIRAETLDPDGYVDHIEFYADEHLIGEQTRLFFVAPPPGQVQVYEMVWTNPPAGRHVLTAKARDELDARNVSLPVVIWVSETNHPPVTNPPPIVSIYAADSLASEGTNCVRWRDWPWSAGFGGTNTATFVIRRSGPTNDNLTVRYRVGGTASNGLDYVLLPGAVTIPAGRRAAEFKIVPLDDQLPEPLETVVLALHVPADLPDNVPPYLIGWPARAAAVIVDNDAPRPITSVLPDHRFHFTKPGAEGSWWRIECSRDLLNWTMLGTNQVTDGALHFVDPDAEEESEGFYRAIPSEAPRD